MKKTILMGFIIGFSVIAWNITYWSVNNLLCWGLIDDNWNIIGNPCMTTPYRIIEGLNNKMNENPYSLDDYCNSLSDWMQPSCELEKNILMQNDTYKKAVEKYEKEQEQIKKQAEIEQKQKELEEKQAELEQKQKELEEENEKLKEIQEKNSQIEETTSKIVEELSKSDEKVMTEEVLKAKEWLWNKAAIFDSLVSLFKAKDQKTQENVKALLKTFAKSKDEYTKNIGIYFWYLVE